jgi:hypothetical protein
MAEMQILQGRRRRDHMAGSHVVQHCCLQGQAHGSAWQIMERPEQKSAAGRDQSRRNRASIAVSSRSG